MLLIGRVSGRGRHRTGFPELRTETFRQALSAAGHDLTLVGLVPPGEEEDVADGVVAVGEEAPGWLSRVEEAASGCEVIVAAGPYNAGRAAVLVAGERPVWVDVPGDPFAEVETAATAQGRALADRQAAAQAAFLPVLARADGFGAVSRAQRLLMLGQLGLAGRLAHPGAAEMVAVCPVAWCFEQTLRPPLPRAPGTPLRVLLSGAFNAWLDVDGVTAALDRLCTGAPQAQVRVTGGPAATHHHQGWDRFAAWAADRPQVAMLGRLSADALQAETADAHVGLLLDGPGLEPESGSRTRALFWLHQGLEVVATTRTELLTDLATRGFAHGVDDPTQAGDALLRCQTRGTDGAMVRAAQEALSAALAPAAAVRPALDFVAAPTRRPAVRTPWDDLARDHAALADTLRAVHASPTWRLLGGLHRRIRALLPDA